MVKQMSVSLCHTICESSSGLHSAYLQSYSRRGRFDSSSRDGEVACGSPGITVNTAADGNALCRVLKSVCWSRAGGNTLLCLAGVWPTSLAGISPSSLVALVSKFSLPRFGCSKFMVRTGDGWTYQQCSNIIMYTCAMVCNIGYPYLLWKGLIPHTWKGCTH